MEYSLRKVIGERNVIIENDEVLISMDTLSFGSIVDRVNIFGGCKLHLDGKSVELEGFDDTDIMQLSAEVTHKRWGTNLTLEFERKEFTPKLVRLLMEE